MIIQFLLTILLVICAVVAAMALLPPQRQRPPDQRARDGVNRSHDWNARDWDDVDPGNNRRNEGGFSSQVPRRGRHPRAGTERPARPDPAFLSGHYDEPAAA